MKKPIDTATKVAGAPYSPGMDTGRTVYVSGQVPLAPKTGKLVPGGIKEQTEQVFANLRDVLKMAEFYATIGVDAISLVPPYYYKMSNTSLFEYFAEVAQQSPLDILLYNIPQFSNEISLPVVKRLALDCPRIIGIKDSSRDFPRFCTMLAQIKPQRPDFACFIGTEEILYPSLVMGGDGGTIASSGVMPEVIVKLYHDFLAGRHDECRRVQLKIQELIAAMFMAGNFPEGFRAAVALRGFNPGPPRFPMSVAELASLEEAKGKLACLLGECGYADAARECELRRKPAAPRDAGLNLDVIVQGVIKELGRNK